MPLLLVVIEFSIGRGGTLADLGLDIEGAEPTSKKSTNNNELDNNSA